MRTIKQTNQFKKDLKRESRGRHAQYLSAEFQAILTLWVTDHPLAPNHRDHALIGDWQDFRDCHIRPDLVLIYRKPDGDNLELVRLGSHSELGL